MILGGSGRGLTKVLSMDFPGGVTKCNAIIRVAVRIINGYLPNEKVEGYNYAIPFFSVLYLLHFRLGKNGYAAFNETTYTRQRI
jgi:hypothetical protein